MRLMENKSKQILVQAKQQQMQFNENNQFDMNSYPPTENLLIQTSNNLRNPFLVKKTFKFPPNSRSK